MMLKRKERGTSPKNLFYLLLLTLFPIIVAAQTEVISISITPKFFDPENSEIVSIVIDSSVPINVEEVHIFTYANKEIIRTGINLIEETHGLYSAYWDGSTDSGSIAKSGLYLVRVYNPVSKKYLSTERAYVSVGPPTGM